MKNAFLLILFGVFNLTSYADDKLPPSAKELTDKLENWETEKRAEFEAEVAAKRAEVVRILERQLTEITRAGNLDGALAIRQKIATLKPQLKETEQKPDEPEHQQDRTRRTLERALVGTKWKMTPKGRANEDGVVITFVDRKNATVGEVKSDWEVTSPTEIKLGFTTVTFNEDLTKFDAIWGRAGHKEGVILKPESEVKP